MLCYAQHFRLKNKFIEENSAPELNTAHTMIWDKGLRPGKR